MRLLNITLLKCDLVEVKILIVYLIVVSTYEYIIYLRAGWDINFKYVYCIMNKQIKIYYAIKKGVAFIHNYIYFDKYKI